jgi:hypothetical protein
VIILKGKFQCQPLGGGYEIFFKVILRKNYYAEARNQHKTIVKNTQQLCERESFATSSQQ